MKGQLSNSSKQYPKFQAHVWPKVWFPQKSGVLNQLKHTGVLLDLMFLPAWTCLIASELWKIFTLLSHQNLNWLRRLATGMSSVFVPGVLLHQQQQLKIKTHAKLHEFQDQRTQQELMQVQERSRLNLAQGSVQQWCLSSQFVFQCFNLLLLMNTRKNILFHLHLHFNLPFWDVQSGFLMGNDSPLHLSSNLRLKLKIKMP